MPALYRKARALAQSRGGLSAKRTVSPIEINPSKTKPHQNRTKQNRLVLFGFIRPNWAFSMGYDESK
jgi:hypothetical protein